MSVYQLLEKINQDKKGYFSLCLQEPQKRAKWWKPCLHSTLAMMFYSLAVEGQKVDKHRKKIPSNLVAEFNIQNPLKSTLWTIFLCPFIATYDLRVQSIYPKNCYTIVIRYD